MGSTNVAEGRKYKVSRGVRDILCLGKREGTKVGEGNVKEGEDEGEGVTSGIGGAGKGVAVGEDASRGVAVGEGVGVGSTVGGVCASDFIGVGRGAGGVGTTGMRQNGVSTLTQRTWTHPTV